MKRLILRPAIFLAVLLTGFSLNIKAQDLNSATLLTRSEQYDKAQAMFQQLIQKEPANSKNYFYLGENYLSGLFCRYNFQLINSCSKSSQRSLPEGC